MKRFLFILLLAPLPAKADTVPGFLLDAMYQQCMKSGGTDGVEAEKQQYCLCMRNKMAAWDESTYEQLAKEMQAGGTQTPPMLQALAKECVEQTMK